MAQSARVQDLDPHQSTHHLDPTIILVGQDICGRYCVCENHGMIGGAFISRADAVRYAQDESRAIPYSIVMVTPLVINVDATDCAEGSRLTVVR